MSQLVRPSFDIPDEILSVIPTDPYDQLDLARKITSLAIGARVTKLEAEVDLLKEKVNEKDRIIVELEDKVKRLQEAFQDAELRSSVTRDDNTKLVKERDILAMTAKKLSRDVSKLETFKRQLMLSLNEDSSSHAQNVDIGTDNQLVSKGYGLREDSGLFGGDEASTQKNAISQYVTPLLTPAGTPKGISISGSPRGYSAAGSPRKHPNVSSPTMDLYAGSGSVSSWFPSSQQTSASGSPRGRPLSAHSPRINGKEFFRHARSRLSYEQFSAFLANVKELNAKKQSREETLRKAEEIFGIDNKELYLYFQSLLSRYN